MNQKSYGRTADGLARGFEERDQGKRYQHGARECDLAFEVEPFGILERHCRSRGEKATAIKV